MIHMAMLSKKTTPQQACPDGAIIEKSLYNDLIDKTGDLHLILNHTDFTTANHIEEAINKQFDENTAHARSAQDIEIHPPTNARKHFITPIRSFSLTNRQKFWLFCQQLKC